MEKYLILHMIRVVFTGNSWDLDSRKCSSQENLHFLRTSVGFQLTNKRNSMAYAT